MLTVAGGILEENGMYLIAQRKRDDDYGLKWEFPGGKLDEGETGEKCIVRELMEELCIEVEVIGFYDEFVAFHKDLGFEVTPLDHCFLVLHSPGTNYFGVNVTGASRR